ncbi:hypothetical protein NA57DRAFT_80971 [Rhizodiscina lignyota]|uniref:Uncharacterized protein n=1 Tax=Rhizodiscina lignyota TaxID=1504668 RepID=A0A9P4I2R4_9PEZI|nr:hypothetical protein NA57DRAFT_80971 [Rhizodiscina lignyota]
MLLLPLLAALSAATLTLAAPVAGLYPAITDDSDLAVIKRSAQLSYLTVDDSGEEKRAPQGLFPEVEEADGSELPVIKRTAQLSYLSVDDSGEQKRAPQGLFQEVEESGTEKRSPQDELAEDGTTIQPVI